MPSQTWPDPAARAAGLGVRWDGSLSLPAPSSVTLPRLPARVSDLSCAGKQAWCRPVCRRAPPPAPRPCVLGELGLFPACKTQPRDHTSPANPNVTAVFPCSGSARPACRADASWIGSPRTPPHSISETRSLGQQPKAASPSHLHLDWWPAAISGGRCLAVKPGDRSGRRHAVRLRPSAAGRPGGLPASHSARPARGPRQGSPGPLQSLFSGPGSCWPD